MILGLFVKPIFERSRGARAPPGSAPAPTARVQLKSFPVLRDEGAIAGCTKRIIRQSACGYPGIYIILIDLHQCASFNYIKMYELYNYTRL